MRVALSILLLIYYLLGNAQSYYSENITSRDGLPDNAIRSIFEDSRGYLWIGTDAGVSRWDGETFSTFNTLDGLAGNKVWWIDEDKYGNIWFACFGGGISQFDGRHFISYTSKDGLVDNSVRVVLYSDAFDCLLIGTNKAISVLKDSVFYNFSKQNGKLPSEVIITSVLADSYKAIFMDFRDKHYIMRMNDEGEPVLVNVEKNWLDKYKVSSCFINSFGDTIIGWKRKGIAIYNGNSIKEIDKIGQVFGIAEDGFNNIWIASWNGGAGLSPPGGLFVIENNKAIRLNKAYNMNTIMGWSAFFEKKQNLIFYGTLDKGLYKIPNRFFEYYHPECFNETNLSVTDIEIDADNNIWFITDSLLVAWDTNSFKKVKLNKFYEVRLDHEINSGRSDDLNLRLNNLNEHYYKRSAHFAGIEFDNNNDLWVSAKGLGFFNIPVNNIDNIIFHSTNDYRDFVFDDADTLFQCHAWSKNLRKFIHFKKSNKFISYRDSLHPIFSKHLINYKNEVWACGRISGVFMLKEGTLRAITDEDTTINKMVNDICFDTEGYAYLGGGDGRIEILSPETRVKIFEINHEEHDNSVQWLKISKNRLFAGYSDGLRIYRLEDLEAKKTNCQFFNTSEGYSVSGVNSSVVDRDGDIWLATNDGLVKIVTELFVGCQFQQLITVIQKVEIFNKDVDWKQYGQINSWSGLPSETPKLAPDQNHISIYFNTLNYNNTRADLYYYKLDDIDKNWIGPSDKKYVVYPNLNPGKYRFLVKSKNELSGLTTEPAEFKFVIRTPWYRQIWFYIFLASLVTAIIIVIYYVRVRTLKKKEERKRVIMQKISELETKALQAQMNPHFLFNSINSIQNYILDNDVDEALTYLNSFSRIIRMTLEFVDMKFISLSDELVYLQHYVKLENMRFDELFDYEVICDKDIDPETTLIPPMLLQPIIENSIKHGIMQLNHKGIIKLEIIKIDENSFKCIIEDNGIGRVKAKQVVEEQIKKESIGLKIIKERLDLFNSKGEDGNFKIEIIDLYSDNGEPSGTRVEIILPLVFN